MRVETTFIAEDGMRFVGDRAGCRRHDFEIAIRKVMRDGGYRGGCAPDVIANIMQDPRERTKLRELIDKYSQFLIEQSTLNR